MHSHIQGLFLLLIVAIALITATRFAAPVVEEAFGPDGALVAVPVDEDTSVEQKESDDPLTGDEVLVIQGHLHRLGFDPGVIDGLNGPNTATAIDEAIAQYRMQADADDRDVLEYLQALVDALDASETADQLPDNQPGTE